MANISGVNRLLRIVIGAILMVWAWSLGASFLPWLIMFLGLVIVLSGLCGWCGFKALFGSSRKSGLNKITQKDIQRAVREHNVKSEKTSATTSSVASAKKAPTKKAAKKASTKKVTKKAPAKKVAKKTSTKKVAKKAPTKKAAKKASAKKVAKKTSTKKVAKKAPTKKAAKK